LDVKVNIHGESSNDCEEQTVLVTKHQLANATDTHNGQTSWTTSHTGQQETVTGFEVCGSYFQEEFLRFSIVSSPDNVFNFKILSNILSPPRKRLGVTPVLEFLQLSS
jgi:hypothetical protein